MLIFSLISVGLISPSLDTLSNSERLYFVNCPSYTGVGCRLVLRCIRDGILFKRGAPKIINCDHARELVGKIRQKISKKFDFEIRSTGGYCAKENLIIESFRAYLNICIWHMSDAQYQNFENFVLTREDRDTNIVDLRQFQKQMDLTWSYMLWKNFGKRIKCKISSCLNLQGQAR